MFPYAWQNLSGKEAAIRELQGSLANGRLNHAYLFSGASGVGKFTLAATLAARFLCLKPRENSACGECASCRMFAENNHPDFLALPRDTRYLKLARFSAHADPGDEKILHPPVIPMVAIKPLLGNGRAVIIPDAERLRNDVANAFLKTLEEPPPHSLFILTAESPRQLLGTIVSRCRVISVAPLPVAMVERELLNRETGGDPAMLKLAAELSGGSLGAAIKFATAETLAAWQKLETAWAHFSLSAAISWGEILIEELRAADENSREKKATLRVNNAKRAELLKWLNLAALKIRQLTRQGKISGLAASAALTVLWKSGERLHANVRPELIALTAAIACFAALETSR